MNDQSHRLARFRTGEGLELVSFDNEDRDLGQVPALALRHRCLELAFVDQERPQVVEGTQRLGVLRPTLALAAMVFRLIQSAMIGANLVCASI